MTGLSMKHSHIHLGCKLLVFRGHVWTTNGLEVRFPVFSNPTFSTSETLSSSFLAFASRCSRCGGRRRRRVLRSRRQSNLNSSWIYSRTTVSTDLLLPPLLIVTNSMLAYYWKVLGNAGFDFSNCLTNIWWECSHINFCTHLHTGTWKRSKFLLCFPVIVLASCAKLGRAEVVSPIIGKDYWVCIVIDVFKLCWIQQSGIM